MTPRNCEACRTLLVRKVFPSGAVEKPGQFKARRFCDHACKMLRHRPRQARSHPWVLAGVKKLEASR
jgi:hypothetical protein